MVREEALRVEKKNKEEEDEWERARNEKLREQLAIFNIPKMGAQSELESWLLNKKPPVRQRPDPVMEPATNLERMKLYKRNKNYTSDVMFH
jgi:hypothetical protein